MPFPAGGPSDLLARILGIKLSESLGQQVVVENRSGVGGVTGVDVVARSTSDGYTIGTTATAALRSDLKAHYAKKNAAAASPTPAATRSWSARAAHEFSQSGMRLI